MVRSRFLSSSLVVSAVFLFTIFICGCGSDEDSDSASGDAGRGPVEMNVDFDWELLEGQFVKFYYQPVDSMRERAPALLAKTEQMYANITFGLQNYEIDTLNFFCFADLKDLLKATGRNYTAIQGDSIFYGYGPVYGKQITQYVMNEIGQPRYLFMQEGLPTAFDYSLRNYHALTYDRLENDQFFGLNALIDNDSYSALDRAEREIQAASLCAFLLTQWGPVSYQQKSEFRQLYESQDDFASACKLYFGAETDEIEERWLEYLPTQTDSTTDEAQQGEEGS